MRIKILKQFPGSPPVGEFLTVDDPNLVKQYVALGYAEEAPDAEPDDDILPALERLVAKALGNVVAKAKSQGPPTPGVGLEIGDGQVTPTAPPALKGLPIFGSAGGFLHAVRNRELQHPDRDTLEKMDAWNECQRKAGLFAVEKGLAKAPSGNFETNDPDGGALIIPEFATTIYERMQLEENFLAQADAMTVTGNTMTFPALDDSSRAEGARWGGFQSAWANEADQLATVSKAKYRTMDLRLKKLYVFCYMTDELLTDSPFALESYLAKYAAKEITWRTNDVMVNGGGGGVPLGVLNSPAKITVSTETGQATQTFLPKNIDKMFMRLNPYCRPNSVWLCNIDTEAALQAMAFPVGIAGVPTYLPPGGTSAAPYATLKGRPVKPVEFCQTLGTEGDLILTDWAHYKAIYKGGVKSEMSMHLRFQYGEMAYRFTYRMDGEPAWDKPLTPRYGTTTTSCIVTLAAR